MADLRTIYDYLRANAGLLGARILEEYPALRQFDDAVSPRIRGLLRTPFPAQTIAIMGVAKRRPLNSDYYYRVLAAINARRCLYTLPSEA